MKSKILIIEDEDAIANLLKDALVESNFDVIRAKNGNEGVQLAFEEHPNLILLDIIMPILDGMTALEVIRSDKWGLTVPVIILTNINADKEILVEAMIKNKPQFYLIKSDWKIADIIKKVKEELDKVIPSKSK